LAFSVLRKHRGLRIRVQGSGFKVQGSGFRVKSGKVRRRKECEKKEDEKLGCLRPVEARKLKA
jgi:hypothetical protein